MYNAPDHMVSESNFICGTYMNIHLPCIQVKYFACMLNLVGTHLAIICEVDIEVVSVLVYFIGILGVMCSFNIMAMCAMFAI